MEQGQTASASRLEQQESERFGAAQSMACSRSIGQIAACPCRARKQQSTAVRKKFITCKLLFRQLLVNFVSLFFEEDPYAEELHFFCCFAGDIEAIERVPVLCRGDLGGYTAVAPISIEIG